MSLTEHLLATGPDLDDPTERERWQCDSDDKAAWCFRKLAAIRAEKDRIKAAADAEIARIEAWRTDATSSLAHDESFFVVQLIAYRHRLEAENPNLPKTYKLPTGSLARRRNPGQTYIGDEAAFVAWAAEHCPGALTPKLGPVRGWDRAELEDGESALVNPETGEIVPGVRVLPGQDRIDVRPAALADLDELEPI